MEIKPKNHITLGQSFQIDNFDLTKTNQNKDGGTYYTTAIKTVVKIAETLDDVIINEIKKWAVNNGYNYLFLIDAKKLKQLDKDYERLSRLKAENIKLKRQIKLLKQNEKSI